MKKMVQRSWSLTPIPCEVQALRIGPMILVGTSGEPFYEIGEKIRAQSRATVLWPLGYTNSYCGYVPTEEEYLRGGYEVDDSWKYVGLWKIDGSCERRVIDAAIEVLAELENSPEGMA